MMKDRIPEPMPNGAKSQFLWMFCECRNRRSWRRFFWNFCLISKQVLKILTSCWLQLRVNLMLLVNFTTGLSWTIRKNSFKDTITKFSSKLKSTICPWHDIKSMRRQFLISLLLIRMYVVTNVTNLQSINDIFGLLKTTK